MTIGPDDVLDFWFGDEIDDRKVAKAKSSLWWSKNEETDNQIRERFLPTIESAVAGELAAWEKTPRGMLALIILVDQFNRNIWRGDGAAFAADHLARDWCRRLIDSGDDQALRPVERIFAYLPLEHSEDLVDQNQCIALFEGMRDSEAGETRELCAGFVGYAEAHQRIIARFGRFPHRNEALSRDSTGEEIEFLTQPDSSF